jgi:coiled-coil domain-containing protein 40
LHQIEAYHNSMKQEIAVTRRATYKAEEAIQNLEKEKGQQDTLIDKLQETLKSLHQQAALLTAQVCLACT